MAKAKRCYLKVIDPLPTTEKFIRDEARNLGIEVKEYWQATDKYLNRHPEADVVRHSIPMHPQNYKHILQVFHCSRQKIEFINQLITEYMATINSLESLITKEGNK
jgi:hypothetical protein